jgi:nicotinate-nucleotide pyrophosphorylase (carboxylating)
MDRQTAARHLIRLALEEDIGLGDPTALAVPPDVRCTANLVAKEDCVASGLELPGMVLEVFGADAKVEIAPGVADGSFIKSGTSVLSLSGKARDILTNERTILNLLQRLFAVATLARRVKESLGGARLQVLDTRKTTPGLRAWEKKAVKDGGLENHRQRLDDGILLKENHIRASGSIKLALANLHGKVDPKLPLEVEVTSWEEAKEALDCGVTRLLLDNFSPEQLKSLVPKIRAYASHALFLEASGGVNERTVIDYISTGVDAVSMGALTHSAGSIDLSLLFQFSKSE